MEQKIEITPLEARIAEVAQYESNIVLYNSILTTLPTEFPEHLQQYKNAEEQHKIAATIDNLQDVELLAKLWYADECKAAIRAEMVELSKAKAILNIMQNNQ